MKEVWEKIQSVYEGDDKVKKAKLQMLSAQFETLKIKEEEDVSSYFLRVDEIVNSTTRIGATVQDKSFVQKIMRTLPTRFNPKVSILKEKRDMDDLTKDELYGILIAY